MTDRIHDKNHHLSDEKILYTGDVVELHNKMIVTEDGAVYVLKDIHPD